MTTFHADVAGLHVYVAGALVAVSAASFSSCARASVQAAATVM